MHPLSYIISSPYAGSYDTAKPPWVSSSGNCRYFVTAQVPRQARITRHTDKVVMGIEGEDGVRNVILKQADQG